jgi:hypothetical protein
MTDDNKDIKADMQKVIDRGEQPSMMEPLLISQSSKHRGTLADLAVELTAHSAGFRRSLPEGVLTALANLI